ncbi:hypothetical protein BG011_009063 [Mortierella polycephala]|uniref:Uncharacterized protein n=1 Tax=Mortierella polycephala TaxID=41804 RepID=A0A9P6PPX3_9FUNG|nr:hypothetical protein BG011_009063 [Mortierella polycephala]
MIRATTTLLLVSALALLGTSSAQVPAAVSTCVIATPQMPLKEGKPYTVIFTGCQGTGNIELRSGSETNLEYGKRPACKGIDFASGSCTFIPNKSGQFSFSAIDASQQETFTGWFNVEKDKSKDKGKEKEKDKKNGSEDKKSKNQETKSTKPANAKAEAARQVEAQKRALYDLAAFGL